MPRPQDAKALSEYKIKLVSPKGQVLAVYQMGAGSMMEAVDRAHFLVRSNPEVARAEVKRALPFDGVALQ